MPTLTQAEYVSAKRRLTTLENKLKRSVDNYCIPVRDEDDPRIPILKKILAECKSAFELFDEKGYPDSWSRWQRATDDAEWQLRNLAWAS